MMKYESLFSKTALRLFGFCGGMVQLTPVTFMIDSVKRLVGDSAEFALERGHCGNLMGQLLF